MKANELRIGNYLWYENTTHIVSGIVDDNVYSWWVKENNPIIELKENGEKIPYIDVISRYESIELTEEWFEKFGFYKDGEYLSKDIADYKYCFKYREWANNWAFYQEFTDSPFKKDNGKKYPVSFDIQFVHQLQNLWFSLLHEELIIK